jgi:drug/metabolite transporter (DMT)-like permease
VAQTLKKLSAFSVNLTFNLEPVYSIVIAIVLFHESRQLNFSFYGGLALVMISVLLQAILNRKEKEPIAVL